MKISFIIPSKNNLNYLKNAYNSIRKHYLYDEIVILDDSSKDGTPDWLKSLNDPNLTTYFNTGDYVGHTVLYNVGVKLCKHDVFSIFHADMICGPNYVQNLYKHLMPKTVVSATRIEPPLHPAGKEKIVMNFGLSHDDLRIADFEKFCISESAAQAGITTKGIFAPWCMYKEDFLAIGGHDELFAPFPFEDSDIFQRFILAGYKIIQSRDSFVYHLTCRGHRWTEQVQKDDEFYKLCVSLKSREFLRKWGNWIKNDEYSYPIIKNKYNIGFVTKNSTLMTVYNLEPWCSTLYTDFHALNFYLMDNQGHTKFNLRDRIKSIDSEKSNDIIVEFDASQLTDDRINFLTSQLSDVLTESGEIGEMEYDIFKINIKSLKTYQNELVVCK
jgi:glycosyltransferase involved in cell wall biosynthesis